MGMNYLGNIHKEHEAKRAAEAQYEFLVIDKYSDISSNWHPVGGRASETRYVIYGEVSYNENGVRHRYNREFEVDGTTYRQAQVGRRYHSSRTITTSYDIERII